MKIFKKILFVFLIFLLQHSVFSQDEEQCNSDVRLINNTSSTVYLKVYPVSMVFSGPTTPGGNAKYDLLALQPPYNPSNPPPFKFIGGTNSIRQGLQFPVLPGYDGAIGFGYDFQNAYEQCLYGAVGLGIYKFEVRDGDYNLIDTFWVEWDYGHNLHYLYNMGFDLYLGLYWENSAYKIKFWWANGMPQTLIADDRFNRYLKAWEQLNSQGAFISRPKDIGIGKLIYDSNNMPFPQDSRRDCYLDDYCSPSHNERNCFVSNLSGVLSNFLSIRTSVSTPATFVNPYDPEECPGFCPAYSYFAKDIVILPGARLELYNNIILTLSEYNNPSQTGAATLTLKGASSPGQGGYFRMLANSQCTIKANSKMILELNSTLDMSAGCQIRVFPGATFCNRGGVVNLNGGTIIIRGNGICDQDAVEPIYQNDGQLIFADSSLIEFPDNSTITIDSNTALVCKPNSVIKFGEGSKLILKHGSKLIANNSTFTSLNAGGTWDGIYSYDLSNDTITNCTIENAVNGINLIDKSSTQIGSTHSAEISGCTFKNSTTTEFTNGIYISNSSNVLIRNNNFTSTQLVLGFTSGLLCEYSTGGLIICDNIFNNIRNGMTLVSSSSYIARNIFNGQSNVSGGLYLDNSSGTIEYNVFNNFINSVQAEYSSPYILSNTFNNFYSNALKLNTQSSLLFKPVNSSSQITWLGGRNILDGTPTDAGITIGGDAYPAIDSGYNKFLITGKDIDGSYGESFYYARLNYWNDAPVINLPSENITSPEWNGTSYPNFDGSNLNSLGFGLYDTVYYTNNGDNPTAENLYHEAYTFERQNNFSQAIAKYKSVIQNFRTSKFAAMSVARILNCMEKANSAQNEYQTIQNYFSNIRASNNYPNNLRELAEDYVIKSKVKRGMVEEAISNYQTMLQQNPNNAKGVHARLNKLCLETMLEGDNPFNNLQSQTSNHKSDLLFLVTGYRNEQNKITITQPLTFKLEQNYPNPFNPKTKIKFTIPQNTFVSMKVYNVTGELVVTLVNNEYRNAGYYDVAFDGSSFASGIYFYTIEAGNFRNSKKMVLVK